MSDVGAKALIMVVSRPDAVDVAVEKMGPKIIGLISSQNIHAKIVQRAIDLEGRARFLHGIVDSPMEIQHAFGRFEYLLELLEEEGYGQEDVVLDATGGTTPMRLGAVFAAMQRGIRMVHQRFPQRYVDGEWKRDESKEIEVVPMDNPLESTGLLREGQAMELFDRRDYGAAALVFKDVVGKVTGAERRHFYNGLLRLSEGYAAWDVADYGAALEKLRAAREELAAGFTEAALSERAAALTGRISGHLSFLGKVRGRLSVENVIDMVENARRRIVDQGRHDDGVARLYRAVEMYHQWRLQEQNGLSTTGVNWEKVPKDAQERFLEATGLPGLPPDLDLTRARALDRVLSAEVAEDDNVFRDLLQKRNNSILAHGLNPVGEGPARKFLEHVDAMVDRPGVRASAGHSRLGGP